jgi:uncharacterized protein YndB with AHSA1/START domain
LTWTFRGIPSPVEDHKHDTAGANGEDGANRTWEKAMTPQTLPTRAVHYRLEIRIDASPDRVWRALTAETDAWWLPDFHVAGPDSRVTLDATPGGHLIERTAAGGGILWYTVHACVPSQSITLVGPVAIDSGPATTMLTLTLEDQDGGCVLRLADRLVGHVSDGLVESLHDGWTLLFGEGLKRYAEGVG